jgi:hypothetical protein
MSAWLTGNYYAPKRQDKPGRGLRTMSLEKAINHNVRNEHNEKQGVTSWLGRSNAINSSFRCARCVVVV